VAAADGRLGAPVALPSSLYRPPSYPRPVVTPSPGPQRRDTQASAALVASAQAFVWAAPGLDPNKITDKTDSRYLNALALSNGLDGVDQLPGWVVTPLSATTAASQAASSQQAAAQDSAESTKVAKTVFKYVPGVSQVVSPIIDAAAFFTSGGGYSADEILNNRRLALGRQAITTIPPKDAPYDVLRAAFQQVAAKFTQPGADGENQTVEQ
jgi:hypothetical protein